MKNTKKVSLIVLVFSLITSLYLFFPITYNPDFGGNISFFTKQLLFVSFFAPTAIFFVALEDRVACKLWKFGEKTIGFLKNLFNIFLEPLKRGCAKNF